MTNQTIVNAFDEKIAGTKTEQNLHTALSAESQAYLRYIWFGKKASREGYEAVADLFRKTAENEKEHAEIWFKFLGGWSTTERNLETAASGENFEWSTMYDEFEKTARAEGLNGIADLFARVASIERSHEENYKKELGKLQSGTMFTSNSEETKWICLNCGYIVQGKEPPQVCPVCSHPQAYFTVKQGN